MLVHVMVEYFGSEPKVNNVWEVQSEDGILVEFPDFLDIFNGCRVLLPKYQFYSLFYKIIRNCERHSNVYDTLFIS